MRKHIYTVLVILLAQTAMAQVVYPPAGQSTYILSSGQSLSVTDGQSIIFGPGTHIRSGATLTALIVNQTETTATDDYSAISLSSNENYIFTRSYQSAMPSFNANTVKEGDVLESISYFDGLGRPIQTIGIKAAPDKEDIVGHIAYDQYGRQEKEWLPYHEPTGSLGAYRGNRASATSGYYKSNYAEDFTTLSSTTANAYSEKEFEASPLNRVLKQAAPGQDWQLGNGNEIEFDYQSNSSNEVRFFDVTTTFANNTYTPNLEQNGYYAVGELYKTITRDENHSNNGSVVVKNHSTEEFTDKQGRVVLKRTFATIISGNSGAGDVPHETYYVYDDFGNLTYVIPPKVTTGSISSTELNELCYQYKYDHRNRLVEKKIPGKGWEYIVYNKLDQPIMTQDPNLRANNQWLFTKYDAFGRVAYTGVISVNSSRAALQTNTNNSAIQYDKQVASANALDNFPVYYSNDAYPNNSLSNTNSNLYTVNYYDSYVDTDGLSVPNTVLGQATTNKVQGLPTVTKVRVLDTNDWITTITGYDAKGRPIYTASKNNYLNTLDIVESKLDFVGKVLETKTTHTKGSNAAIVTTDYFTYDHEARLIQQKQTIGGQAQETLVDNTYDNLGLMVQKEVGGGLQSVDYKYNVRGWLKQINNPASLGNDLFAFDINYNTADHNGKKLYNGNISETEWKTANDNQLRWYRYDYDALNRITAATGSSSNYNLSNISYDKNGNLLTLTRRGHTNAAASSFGVMDELNYTYLTGNYTNETNKLTRVQDSGNKDYGFKDGASNIGEYSYDQNGNMISDANKGITDITYNHLNLPTQVTISDSSNNGTIAYIYDATGIKQKKAVSTGTTTEYAGNYIYENGKLTFFDHAEGYVEPRNPDNLSEGFDYVYQYTDHLGNIRLSYKNVGSSSNVNLEIQEENNYYPFGLRHKGYNNVVSSNANSVASKFKYNGKELEESLGLNLYEMDMRQYDPAIARWTSIDPVTHWSMSTYNAFDNNPVYFADPSGANSTAEWMEANGITQDDLITIYQAPSDDNNGDDSSSDCPPGDPNCNKGADGKIQNQFEMSVDTEDMVTPEMAALMITLVEADGPLPFGDGAAATIGLNILVAYAIAHGSVGMINSINESVLAAADANWVYAKQEKEINRIMTKEGGPPGMVYMLTVNQSGNYLDARGNSTYLNAGEVWKYGETTKGYGRYSQSKLDAMVPGGVTMNPIFFGNTVQIKVQEKIMIYGHFLATGSLPPGNKIFR